MGTPAAARRRAGRYSLRQPKISRSVIAVETRGGEGKAFAEEAVREHDLAAFRLQVRRLAHQPADAHLVEEFHQAIYLTARNQHPLAGLLAALQVFREALHVAGRMLHRAGPRR